MLMWLNGLRHIWNREMEEYQTSFREAIENTPIIPAVKDEESLAVCLKSDSSVIFILFGDICSIADIVERIKEKGKLAMVHMDLIAGLGSKEVSVDYIKKRTRADGIITTKPILVKRAKELGLAAVLRFFIIDSMALANLSRQTREARPDCIEVLPGVMPKVIRKITKENKIPLIAGGLIADKEDVCNALDAGAVAVSATNTKIWFL